MFYKKNVSNELIKCKCGCNIEIRKYDKRGREMKYFAGHNRIGKSNTWRIKDKVKIRTSRARAVKILRKVGIIECQVNNKDCKGILESHHIDKNPFNNDISNLNLLCRTHHRLADLRHLSLEELKNLNLVYIISSNKRRYSN